jgi:hypothetical protein
MTVIPSSWEEEVGQSWSEAHVGKSARPILKNNLKQKGLPSKHKALIQNQVYEKGRKERRKGGKKGGWGGGRKEGRKRGRKGGIERGSKGGREEGRIGEGGRRGEKKEGRKERRQAQPRERH